MKLLRKRLHRLESHLFDQSSYKRYSDEWLSYWGEQAERHRKGERGVPRMPIEFFDFILAKDDAESATEDG